MTVIDGALQNAVVCLDLNRNDACDAGEPSGRTDAAGKATLLVAPGDVGKYPVLALVGTDAVDADHGPVGTAFVLKAPADRQNVVSPLTTLVQATIENTGVSSADAEAVIKAQLGVSGSLFQDFTKGSTDESARLGEFARLVVVVTQEQIKNLAPAVGTTAMDGKAIALTDVHEVVVQKMLQVLPQVVTTLADPRLGSASGATKGEIISTLAQELVAQPSVGLSTTTLQTLVAVARGTDTTPDTGAPAMSASLTTLNFFDAGNWFRRLLTTSVAQATPDAAGMLRFVDRRARSTGGAIAEWSFGGEPVRQNDFHFSGSAWVQCPMNFESTVTPRDAQGRSSYNYCDGHEKGVSIRSSVDIAGRPMTEVYQQIQAAGYTNINIREAASALGSATFPAGARMFFHVSTPLQAAVAYSPNVGTVLRVMRSDVASGQQSACNQITSTTPLGSYTSTATSLDAMIAANRGTPCVFQPNADSGSRNEWWSQSTVSAGTLGNAPVGGPQSTYYTTNTYLRVAFGANDSTTYYSCQQRAADGSVRNCNAIGTGNYAVSNMGDARILRLTNEPAAFAALNYQRVFVERAGQVYFGYQNRVAASSQARLNLEASNALLSQLGIATVDPEVPLAPTAGSFQGDWIVDEVPPELGRGSSIRFSIFGGATTCFDNATNAPYACTVTLNPANGAITYSDAEGSGTGVLNVNTGSGSGTFTRTGGTATSFTAMRR